MILVVGSTGMVGLEICRLLAEKEIGQSHGTDDKRFRQGRWFKEPRSLSWL